MSVDYEHLLKDNKKIQVDSAIRDGTGVKIDTNYEKLFGHAEYGNSDTIYLGSVDSQFSSLNDVYTYLVNNYTKTFMGRVGTGDSGVSTNLINLLGKPNFPNFSYVQIIIKTITKGPNSSHGQYPGYFGFEVHCMHTNQNYYAIGYIYERNKTNGNVYFTGWDLLTTRKIINVSYDSTNKKLQRTNDAGTITDVVTFGDGAFSSVTNNITDGSTDVLTSGGAYENIMKSGYYFTITEIDTTSLDGNTFYPVIIDLQSTKANYYGAKIRTRIEIRNGWVSTNGGWSSHAYNAYSAYLSYDVSGYNWGERYINRIIHLCDCNYCKNNINPIRNLGQLTNTSKEYVYVRGGSKYYFYTSNGTIPELKTSRYTPQSDYPNAYVEPISINADDSLDVVEQTLPSIAKSQVDAYPIGAIYISTSSTSPARLFGGTWTQLDAGYTLWTATSGAGNTISAGLPNIKGSFASLRTWSYTDPDGAFSTSSNTNGPNGNVDTGRIVNFNAHSYNSIYSDDVTTVQPPAYKVYMWRRIS